MPADALIYPYKYYHKLPIHVKYIIFLGKRGRVEEWKEEGWKGGRMDQRCEFHLGILWDKRTIEFNQKDMVEFITNFDERVIF